MAFNPGQHANDAARRANETARLANESSRRSLEAMRQGQEAAARANRMRATKAERQRRTEETRRRTAAADADRWRALGPTPDRPGVAEPLAGPGGARSAPATDAAVLGRTWPPGSAAVASVERRTESMDGQFFQVLSLRLLRLQDGRRPGGQPIAVELRGRAILGSVSKGDVVMLPQGSAASLLATRELHNLTTGVSVAARGRPFRRMRTASRVVGKVLRWVFGIVVLALFGLILYAVLVGTGAADSLLGG